MSIDSYTLKVVLTAQSHKAYLRLVPTVESMRQGHTQKTLKMWDVPIHFAAEKGDLSEVKRLVEEEGVDVNIKGSGALTPLHWASRNDHAPLAQYLLDKGADVNERDEYGWSALHFASNDGHVALAELLLSRGAHVNATDNEGWSPLHRASLNNRLSVARLLINKGADKNIRNGMFQTAEDLAGYELTELLASSSCSTAPRSAARNVLQPSENTFFDIVKENNVSKLKERLLQTTEETLAILRSEHPHKEGLLHIAIKNKNKEMLKLLIASGIKVNSVGTVDGKRLTPLMVALKLKQRDLAQLLIQNGAEPRYLDSNGAVFDAVQFARQCGAQSLTNIFNRETSSDTINLSSKQEELQKAKELLEKVKTEETQIKLHDDERASLKLILEESDRRAEELRTELEELNGNRTYMVQELQETENKLTKASKRVIEMRLSSHFKTESEISHLSKVIEDALKVREDTATRDDPRECKVCLEIASQAYICLQCENWFCQLCVTRLNSCPNCRQDFSSQKPTRNRAIERALGL